MQIIETNQALVSAVDPKNNSTLTRNFFRSVMLNDGLSAQKIGIDSYHKSVLSPNIEGTASAGGYLVPEEFSSEVISSLRKASIALSECRIITMSTNVLNISTLVGTPSLAWTSENQAIASSKGTFGRLTLTAQKLAAIIPASNELLEDNNVNYPALMSEAIKDPFAIEIDTQVFRGSGSPFTGILNTSGVSTVYLGASSSSGKKKYTDITWDDLYNFVNTGLPTRDMVGAKLYIQQEVFNVLMKLKAAGSGEYFQPALVANFANPSGLSDGYFMAGNFMGFPVMVCTTGTLIETYDGSDHVSTPFCIFANLKRSAWIGEVGTLQVDISQDATVESVNAYANDLKLWRFKMRLAFGIGLPATIAVLSTSAS